MKVIQASWMLGHDVCVDAVMPWPFGRDEAGRDRALGGQDRFDTGGLADGRHVSRVATEGADLVAHPAQRQQLVA